VPPLSSPSNPTVKAIRTLRHRKERDATGTYWVEGIRLVGEAAELGAPIDRIVISPELLTSDYALSTVERLRSTGIPVIELSPTVFKSLAWKEHPQGIGAVLRQRWLEIHALAPSDGLCWVALDRIADPGNLGAIIRTCDATGASGVILIGASTDPFDPTAVRGSMGALFSVQLTRATEEQFLQWCSSRSLHLIGTSDRATTDYRAAQYPRPCVLVMGSERAGLSDGLLRACDPLVRIPMLGRSDSLNLAVATGVLLYQLLSQQQ
jgi:RNA methyltransferase, TrmH family